MSDNRWWYYYHLTPHEYVDIYVIVNQNRIVCALTDVHVNPR